MSTGMLYRTVGLLSLRAGVDRNDPEQLKELIKKHTIALTENDKGDVIIKLDGKEIFDELYTPEVSEATSEVAVHKEVRSALIPTQRSAFPEKGLVAEGRDMGTVIFTEAPVKFWVHTDQDTKVARRMAQILTNNPGMSPDGQKKLEDQMSIEIYERDKRDQERGLSPSIKSDEMIEIDNSERSIEEVLEEMLSYVRS